MDPKMSLTTVLEKDRSIKGGIYVMRLVDIEVNMVG